MQPTDSRTMQPLTPEQVASLAVQARDGSMESLGRLYELYSDQVWAHIYRRSGGNRALTDDVTSAAWEKVVEKIATYDPDRASFARFVYVIAGSTLASIARREGHARTGRELHAHMIAHGSSEASAEVGPDQSAERADEARRLAKIVNALPRRQREALLLTVFDGYSLSDAAQVMGVTSSAVKMARLRAFETLRTRFGPIERALSGRPRVEIVNIHVAEAHREV